MFPYVTYVPMERFPRPELQSEESHGLSLAMPFGVSSLKTNQQGIARLGGETFKVCCIFNSKIGEDTKVLTNIFLLG